MYNPAFDRDDDEGEDGKKRKRVDDYYDNKKAKVCFCKRCERAEASHARASAACRLSHFTVGQLAHASLGCSDTPRRVRPVPSVLCGLSRRISRRCRQRTTSL